jgi:hypothetical protein
MNAPCKVDDNLKQAQVITSRHSAPFSRQVFTPCNMMQVPALVPGIFYSSPGCT